MNESDGGDQAGRVTSRPVVVPPGLGFTPTPVPRGRGGVTASVLEAAKADCLRMRSLGLPMPVISAALGVYNHRLERWRKADEQFNAEWVRLGRAARAAKPRKDKGLTFAGFRQLVFGHHTFSHQEQWTKWAEDPEASHIMIVTAPEFSKSTWALHWLLKGLVDDPSMRCAYITHSNTQARARVGYLRRIIEENPRVTQLAGRNLVPEKGDNRPWSEDRFMLAARDFSTGDAQVDYSLAGFGHNSQIAGTRLDRIIIDDIDGKMGLSPGERLKIYEKIVTEVEGRRGTHGRMVLLTNRWDSEDVAGLIERLEVEYPGLWKIYRTPAVLRWPDEKNPEDFGEVVWPERWGRDITKTKADAPVNPSGHWSAQRAIEYFKKKRALMGKKHFELVYQCNPEGAVGRSFDDEDIDAAIARGSKVTLGSIPDDPAICVQDPGADVGCATLAAVVNVDAMFDPWRLRDDPDALPKVTLADLHYADGLGSSGMLQTMDKFARRWRPDYFGIEGQGSWKAYVEHPETIAILNRAGVQLERFNTGADKRTDDVGIGSMQAFIRDKLIIPSGDEETRARFQPLVDQLRAYRPPEYVGIPGAGGRWLNRSGRYDCVMTLWFVVRMLRLGKFDRRVATGWLDYRVPEYEKRGRQLIDPVTQRAS